MGNFKLDGRTIAIIALVVIAAVIFLPRLLGGNGLFGGSDPTPTPVIDADPRDTTIVEDGIELGQVVMARNVDRDGCAVDVTSSFPEGTDLLYIVADNSDFAQGTEVFVRWYRDGQAYEDAEPITANEDFEDICINFTLDRDDASEIPPGDYEGEFIINGNPADAVTFTVG